MKTSQLLRSLRELHVFPYHLLYLPFVLHTICFTYHLFYIPFVLHTICFTYHLFYLPFVLHTICFTYHLFYIPFVLHYHLNITRYGVATISRLLNITGLFCRI